MLGQLNLADFQMNQIARAVTDKFPVFILPGTLLLKPAQLLIEKINYEREINALMGDSHGVGAVDFIDQLFEQFNFTYQVTARERQNIPDQGRVVIIANQPVASLHALAVVRLICELRRDVYIVWSDSHTELGSLSKMIICADAWSSQNCSQQITDALNDEAAVIIFPAGNFIKPRATSGKHTAWRPDFLHYCRSTQTPVLPLFIKPQKQLMHFSSGFIPRFPRATSTANNLVKFKIGELIAPNALANPQLTDKALLNRLRKHVFKLGRNRKSTFVTLKTIAHPEDRSELQKDLRQATLLGKTRDDNGIYLADFHCNTLMREIGRMREFTFRKVGEGTGSKRDLDDYDPDYHHLLLWNQEQLEIAGGYRLGHTATIIKNRGISGLYTHSLFDFSQAMAPYFENAVELGRSFVAPKYWGKNSLDYLWQGIGAYFKHHTDVRYVFGPVSISADYPRALTAEMVFYYEHFYGHVTSHATLPAKSLARGRTPFLLSAGETALLQQKYAGHDKESGFKLLQDAFTAADSKIPVLFKQYAALYEDGGFKLLAFNIDPDFANCIDGLFMADLTQLKANKRKRYLGE